MMESDVKRDMSKSMKDADGYARRFEDAYAVGLFDMLLIPKGLPVFTAEVKLIRGDAFGLTPRQLVELGRIEQVAADSGHIIPVMIGFKDRTYFFHQPKVRVQCNDCFFVTTLRTTFHDQLVEYYHSIKGSK
jgi:hypothetical protein